MLKLTLEDKGSGQLRYHKGSHFRGRVDPYGVRTLRVKANSILCVQCGR